MNTSIALPRMSALYRLAPKRSCAIRMTRSLSSCASRLQDAPSTPSKPPSAPSKAPPPSSAQPTASSSTETSPPADGSPKPARATGLGSLASAISGSSGASRTDFLQDILKYKFANNSGEVQEARPYFMKVLSHRHNTHITVTDPDGSPLKKLSLSAGNIGFKKANRGSYDAAFQLFNYVINRIQEQGLLRKIEKMDVIFRGYGNGRDAVKSGLVGKEGQVLRERITSVSDATRIKFGGTRSRARRRI